MQKGQKMVAIKSEKLYKERILMNEDSNKISINRY